MILTRLFHLITLPFLLSNASPLHRRQYDLDCGSASSCAVYSGTSIWFEAMTGDSCPPITPPPAVAIATATPTDHPESCFYPKSMDYCQLGQYPAMQTMSSIATAIYNAQSSGAVLCGATKTANLPIIAANSPSMCTHNFQRNCIDVLKPVTVTPVSQITVEAQPGRR